MRKILIIVFLTSIFACNSSGNKKKNDTKKDNTSSTKTETQTNKNPNAVILSDLLADIRTLEKIKDENPIALFQKLAEDKASKILIISKDNIKDILSSAKVYNNCIITTGNHTIVKIIDSNNCKQSASWGACMPFVTGYIKKGELILQEDYINNIIGIPDSQIRKAYLFD